MRVASHELAIHACTRGESPIVLLQYSQQHTR